eukprot:364710-Chlamydomonas_euryale.AAC.7
MPAAGSFPAEPPPPRPPPVAGPAGPPDGRPWDRSPSKSEANATTSPRGAGSSSTMLYTCAGAHVWECTCGSAGVGAHVWKCRCGSARA